MTDQSRPQDGEMQMVPEGAYVVYPQDVVVKMFGHADASSTRSLMGKHGYPTMIKGWEITEVEDVLSKRDPKLVKTWRIRKSAQQEEK